MTMKSLIINGDDFGISSATNRAILRAHREGVLTSASLMVNGAAFEEAVALAKEHPTLSVGLHLVLVHGKSTLPQAEIPDLVNEQGFSENRSRRHGLFLFPSFKIKSGKSLRHRSRNFSPRAFGLPILTDMSIYMFTRPSWAFLSILPYVTA
jgi:hypothetical protein